MTCPNPYRLKRSTRNACATGGIVGAAKEMFRRTFSIAVVLAVFACFDANFRGGFAAVDVIPLRHD